MGEIIDIKKQAPGGMAWMGELIRNSEGRINTSVKNTIILIQNDPELRGLLVWNEFSSSVITTGEPPVLYSSVPSLPGP